jgi:hypothetical protein
VQPRCLASTSPPFSLFLPHPSLTVQSQRACF